MKILSQKPVDVTMKTDGEYPVRQKTEVHPCAVLAEYRQTGECGGEIREREGMQVIAANGELCLTEVRGNGGTMAVKGDAYVTALLLSPEGNYVTAKSRIPVEEEIPVPIPGSEEKRDVTGHAAAFGEVILLEMQAAEDGVLTWRMEYDIDCVVLKCAQASAVTDAYLVGCADVPEVAAYDSVYPAGAVNGRLTVQETAKLKPGMACVCAWGRATADRVETSKNRMILTGNAVLSVVESGGGEAILDELTLPYRYECEALTPETVDPACLTGKISVRVTDIQARADGDILTLTAELALSAAVLGLETIKCVSSQTPVPESGSVRKSDVLLRLYVPDEGESAWDVEKRFRLGHDAKAEGAVYVI
jgi:hypothetical protein